MTDIDVNQKKSFIKHNVYDLEREDKIVIVKLVYNLDKDKVSFSQNRTLFDLDQLHNDLINTIYYKIQHLIRS